MDFPLGFQIFSDHAEPSNIWKPWSSNIWKPWFISCWTIIDVFIMISYEPCSLGAWRSWACPSCCLVWLEPKDPCFRHVVMWCGKAKAINLPFIEDGIYYMIQSQPKKIWFGGWCILGFTTLFMLFIHQNDIHSGWQVLVAILHRLGLRKTASHLDIKGLKWADAPWGLCCFKHWRIATRLHWAILSRSVKHRHTLLISIMKKKEHKTKHLPYHDVIFRMFVPMLNSVYFGHWWNWGPEKELFLPHGLTLNPEHQPPKRWGHERCWSIESPSRWSLKIPVGRCQAANTRRTKDPRPTWSFEGTSFNQERGVQNMRNPESGEKGLRLAIGLAISIGHFWLNWPRNLNLQHQQPHGPCHDLILWR